MGIASTLLLYMMENIQYFTLLSVSLLLWDIIDFYIELENFDFLKNAVFAVYYLTRLAFCLLIMEIAYNLNFFDVSVKYLVAFVLPLFFAGVLQNLVVYIGKTGGETGNINLREVFDKFKFQVQRDLRREEETKRIAIERQLIASEVTTDALMQSCKLYLRDEEFRALTKRIQGLASEEKRLETVKILGVRAGRKGLSSLLSNSK